MVCLWQVNILTRIRSAFSARSNADDPRFWQDFFSLGKTKSGQSVDIDNAMRASAVQACVRVLSETIASLPLFVYERTQDGGKKVASNHYLYKLLHDSPNPYQTAFEFIEMLMGHTLMRGNFYGYKEITKGQEILKIIPLNTTRMKPELNNGEIFYSYTDEKGTSYKWPQSLIWHVKDSSHDGITGLSRIAQSREAIGLALAAEEHGSRYFGNGAQPGGILSVPGKLTEDARKRLKESWNDAHTGGANAFKVAVLEGGLDWKQVGLSNEDSQFLQVRQFQVEEIARIFRVPAILIGYSDKASTYASAEQFMLSFVVHTIRPWLVRIEKSINKYLLSETDQKKYFAEFQIAGLLRGDTLSRYQAYQIARQNKWMNANEIRALENMNPIEGGDIYENPAISVTQPQKGDMNNANA